MLCFIYAPNSKRPREPSLVTCHPFGLMLHFHSAYPDRVAKEAKVMRMDQQSTSSIGLPAFLAIALLVLLALACGSKLGGTFSGSATVYGGGYNLDEHITDVTVTVALKETTRYYLTFGDKSPIQCKLVLDNMTAEDNNPDNDEDLEFRRIVGNDTCELRGTDGQVQTAKVSSISGGRQRDGYLSLIVTLEAKPTFFNFSYQGWTK